MLKNYLFKDNKGSLTTNKFIDMKNFKYYFLATLLALIAFGNSKLVAQSGPPFVTVTSPNGGETAVRGQNFIITWEDNLTSNVVIDLYSGTSSSTCTFVLNIAGSVPGTSHTWWVPTWVTPNNNYFVRISRIVNPNGCTDYSNNPFTISAYSATPVITVTSPAGGVTWEKGVSHDIVWTDNIPENVKVDYKKTTESTWNTISWSTSGNILSWYIADYIPSGQYNIRVSSVENPTTVNGLSYIFTISAYTSTPTITFTSPVGSPTWPKGTLRTISWIDNLPENVNVEYRKGTTGSWNGIAWGVAGGSQDWYIPDYLTAGNDYYIKVSSSVDPTGINQVSDPFTISAYTTTPTITVTDPNGGFVQKSQIKQIHWTTNIPENVKIDLYKGGVFMTTIAGSVNSSPHNWYVNDWITDGNDYKIRISSVNDAEIKDESDANFTISAYAATATLTVTAPTGATSWLRATTQTIGWSKTDIPENVKIDLFKGGVYQMTIAGSVPGTSHNWYIPDYLTAGTDYAVKVTSVNNASLTDLSENFAILAYSGTASITVIAPVGGAEWLRSQFQTITWNKGSIPENVKIDLYKSGSVYVQTIEWSVPGSSHNWYINDWIEPRNDYKIRISSVNNPGITGESGTFSILAYSSTATITVTQPAGNPTWQRGTIQLLSWTKTGIPENVKIDLYKGGSFVSNIAWSVPNESHNWYINDWLEAGSNYTIRVTSINNPVYTDESDPFSISISAAGATVTNVTTVGTPWIIGTSNNIINWQKISVPEDVKIILINSGTFEERVLTYGTPGTSYNWYIPTYIVAGTYTIKVVSTVNPLLTSTSAPFQISLYSGAASISNVTPVGAPWQKGTIQQITWVKTDIPENVSIDLYKGGVFQLTIASSVPGQSHNWYVPDYLATAGNYMIKVASVNNPSSKHAESGTFTITTSTSVGTITNVSPTVDDQWYGLGANLTLTWNKTITENVNIELIDYTNSGSPVATQIASWVSGTSHNWYISPWLAEGDKYKIRVYSVLDNNTFGLSHEFHLAQYDVLTYPNPAGPVVRFKVKDHQFISNESNVELYDRFGVRIFSKTVSAGSLEDFTVPTETLPNGIYYMVLTSGERRVTRSVVVQH